MIYIYIFSLRHFELYIINILYIFTYIIIPDFFSIWNNRKIKTNADAENVTPLDLYFGYDELADFEPTENYLITQHHCDQVVSEFNTLNHPLTMNDLKNWLDTHDLLYKSVEDKYMYFKFNDFKHLYFRQKYLFEKFSAWKNILFRWL